MPRLDSTRQLTRAAVIAALYAALTFAVFFMSFGAVQYRVSEALTVLPVFTAAAAPGLTAGCVLANLVGFFIGANPIGWIDALVGSLATLLAALATRAIGKSRKSWVRYAFAPLPPVLINAVLVGLELTMLFGPLRWNLFLGYAASVLAGEAVVCYGLGLPLMAVLSRPGLAGKIF